MLNKRTILFFTDTYNVSVAENVTKEFVGNNSVVSVIVTKRELRSAFYNAVIDKVFPEGGSLRPIALNKRIAVKNGKMDSRKKKHFLPSIHNPIQKRMLNALNRYNPSVVAVTDQSLLTDVLAAIDKYGSRIKLAVIPEDYVLDKRFISGAVDYYFVDNFDMRNALVENGISDDKVVICGLPVNKKFFVNADKEQALKKFGLSDSRPKILVSCSQAGDKRFREVLEELKKADLGVDYIVACGKNRKLLNYAREAGFSAYNDGIDINAALTACDAVITRPTTMLMAEAMVKNKDVFALMPVGKMEESNLNYLGIDQITKITTLPELVNKIRNFKDMYDEIKAEEAETEDMYVGSEKREEENSSHIVASNLISISTVVTEE